MRWNHWTLVGLGGWLLISPWVLGYSAWNLVLWNSVLVGVFVVVFALANLSGPPGNGK